MQAMTLNPTALGVIMERSGLSATTLAAACDPPINRSYVVNILAGRRQPSSDIVVRLAGALKIPVVAILSDAP